MEFSFWGVDARARIVDQIEAGVNLAMASASKASSTSSELQPPTEEKVRQVANAVALVKPKAMRHLAEASVLWVDDHPDQNSYERRALEALGVRVTMVKTTEEALDRLRHNTYDVIISDAVRAQGERAGYTLLEQKQRIGKSSPVILYDSSGLPDDRELRARGAIAGTCNPQELFELIVNMIQKS